MENFECKSELIKIGRTGEKLHYSYFGAPSCWDRNRPGTACRVKGKVHAEQLCKKCFGSIPTAELQAEMGVEVV
jgi:hypothetical protein